MNANLVRQLQDSVLTTWFEGKAIVSLES
jgi:hypothetical protein